MVQCLGMPRESLLQFRGKFGLVLVWDDILLWVECAHFPDPRTLFFVTTYILLTHNDICIHVFISPLAAWASLERG